MRQRETENRFKFARSGVFVGNEDGGFIAALFFSLAVTCKDNNVDFEAWLNDILPRLETTPASEIDSLLPHLWKKNEN